MSSCSLASNLVTAIVIVLVLVTIIGNISAAETLGCHSLEFGFFRCRASGVRFEVPEYGHIFSAKVTFGSYYNAAPNISGTVQAA